MSHRYAQVWDLDVFFPGGSRSPQLAQELEVLEQLIPALAGRAEALAPAAGDGADAVPALAGLISDIQDAAARLEECASFVACLSAQDVHDQQARLLETRVAALHAAMSNLRVRVDHLLAALPDRSFAALLADPRMAPIAFELEHSRRLALDLLPVEQEELINDLAVDGYHAWGLLYQGVAGRFTVEVEEDGRTVRLSAGQAANRLESPDRAVRQAVWEQWEAAWAGAADLCAAALNHLGGFRLAAYRRRGWASVLKEPLDLSRMSQATLDAMWSAVEANAHRLLPYLQRKARLLGVDAPAWHDVSAPLAAPDQRVSYDDAVDFILEQFSRFSPDLRAFAEQAVRGRWIEAEDRPGKQAGGFCAPFPVSGQSRIFMTFGGTTGNITTLAHELGHAYHSHVLADLPYLAQRYPMTLAETASTFAESIVADAAIRHAADERRRLALLDEKLQKAVVFLMNIRARFLFETAFYERRAQGPLTVDELNRLMEHAQKQAYLGGLSQYHPHFWASKLHFYVTDVPFYNFPYTFGFLFSSGIYARARAEGPAFAGRYVALLRDTGRMTVEDLARRHLGVDLTGPEFWQEGIDAALADVDQFLRLSEPLVAGAGNPEA
ncbi:MAG: M3 family oligoendopeptidase [Thermaerobacter sp.]|nr:oligoendopeptidase [Bacillota bacterium]REJ37537.1 MAG: oligoendopeptidase [Bacillota bacterium]